MNRLHIIRRPERIDVKGSELSLHRTIALVVGVPAVVFGVCHLAFTSWGHASPSQPAGWLTTIAWTSMVGVSWLRQVAMTMDTTGATIRKLGRSQTIAWRDIDQLTHDQGVIRLGSRHQQVCINLAHYEPGRVQQVFDDLNQRATSAQMLAAARISADETTEKSQSLLDSIQPD